MGDTYKLYRQLADRIENEKKMLFARTGRNFRLICNEIVNRYSDTGTGIENEYKKALKSGRPSAFFRKFEIDLSRFMTPDLLTMFYYEIDHIREFQYDNSMFRRNFRSNDYSLYINKIHQVLEQFMTFPLLHVDINDYLRETVSEEVLAYKGMQWGTVKFPFVIGAYIDSGDPAIKKTIEDVVLGSDGNVCIELIRGVFLSGNEDMYRLMEKLLLAARLQEGLRQAVCENMDFGRREAFDYMFRVILDNDLMRFSSVQRALEMCVGLLTPDGKGGDRLSKKQAALAESYLNDANARETAFKSDDHMEVYMALWAIGTKSIEDACKKAEGLVFNGNREQSLTAAFFMARYSDDSRLSLRILEEKTDGLDILAVVLSHFMSSVGMPITQAVKDKNAKYFEFVDHRCFANPEYYFEDSKEARKAYYDFKRIMDSLPNKKVEFNGLVFPWTSFSLTKTDCITRMVFCASASMDKKLTLEVARDIVSVDKLERAKALALLLNEPENREEYEILTKAIGDAEEATRDRANHMLQHELKRDTTVLEPEIRAGIGKLPDLCYEILEDLLRSKKSDVRRNAIALLMTRDDEDKISMIERLLSDRLEEKRTAALDMLMQMKKDNSPLFVRAAEKTAVITSPTTKEQVLLDEINGTSGDACQDVDEGFGFFDPDAIYEPVFDQEKIKKWTEDWNRVFPNKKIGRKLFSFKTKIDDLQILRALDNLIEKNKDLEYEKWGEKRLLGNGILVSYVDGHKTIPFMDMWETFFTEKIKTEDELLRISFLIRRMNSAVFRNAVKGYAKYCNENIEKYFGAEFNLGDESSFKHYKDFGCIIEALIDKHSIYELKSDIGRAVAYYLAVKDDTKAFVFTKADVDEKQRVYLQKDKMTRTPVTDPVFGYIVDGMIHNAETFPVKYALVRKFRGEYKGDDSMYRYYTIASESNDSRNVPTIGEYISACAGGVISKDILYKRIFGGFESQALRLLTNVIIFIRENNDVKSTRVRHYEYRINQFVAELLGRDSRAGTIDPDSLSDNDKKILALAEECYETCISVCVGKELRRGDSPTEYTGCMNSVERIYGLSYFVRILKAFGKDTFNRSRYLSYGRVASKADVLSSLLAVCVPDSRDGDVKEQAQKLKEMIKGTDIKEKRLIEAALFSPEWLDVVGELLGFEGFRSGCYYFMAHMNERFDEKRKAAIAKYSPISMEEFNAGAFDKNWFDEVYALLGEKKFNEIYEAAKYISDGAKHARARKYADAATGKLDPLKTREEIEKKRNKDLLMAYAILSGSDDEIRERYCYIRQFIKESKKFGAQRRASEKLAGETAIKNMATSNGYQDETRFILKMENDIASELASFWELKKVGEVEMCLTVNSGKVDIRVVKGGKELKSVPSALKKDEYVLDLQEAKKTFTEQYRRTKIMLEEAMESRTAFVKEEIDAMRMNPVLAGMLDSLVFESDGKFGLWKDLEVKPGAEVYVAHSYTMFKAGVWKDMQSLIFDQEIVQPFKQVFRELYVKTAEEIECYDSRRYAGNQIQPKMTIAVLKNRRWIADVEDGLQKIYYKENIIATIYALADWFSPSDIEAPTLEWVAFHDRKTGELIKISDVPDIIFSEVMRDVDLAVSVAHAGEVDPEMSHSTIEMRLAVAEFTCRSFKLKNVSFTGSHALIHGKRANYTVHLGSGVIHLEGGLMINVLPVHSQKRGRIFLPFVDDDPKTSEIISKILLFAEDNKIKDPFILEQIV